MLNGIATYYSTQGGTPTILWSYPTTTGNSKRDYTQPNGPTPPGVYQVDQLLTVGPVENRESFCPPDAKKKEQCWFAPMIPLTPMPEGRCRPTPPGRCGLHPDGGAPGTAGCVGFPPTKVNTDEIRSTLEKGLKSEPIFVAVGQPMDYIEVYAPSP